VPSPLPPQHQGFCEWRPDHPRCLQQSHTAEPFKIYCAAAPRGRAEEQSELTEGHCTLRQLRCQLSASGCLSQFGNQWPGQFGGRPIRLGRRLAIGGLLGTAPQRWWRQFENNGRAKMGGRRESGSAPPAWYRSRYVTSVMRLSQADSLGKSATRRNQTQLNIVLGRPAKHAERAWRFRHRGPGVCGRSSCGGDRRHRFMIIPYRIRKSSRLAT